MSKPSQTTSGSTARGAQSKPVSRRVVGLGLEVKDLVRPPASRRGVRAHASDRLSRLERRAIFLPI